MSSTGGRPPASVSLDADNLWSYMKTHGDPDWAARPSYLSALTPRMLDVFGEYQVPATVFVVGHDAAKDDGAAAVAELAAAGHEIGNHSYEHEPWLHLYSREQLDDELGRTEDVIVKAGAPRPIGFRGPGYSLSPELLQLLAERGYRYDATTLPTWIGPLARAYYFRSAKLPAEERAKRKGLFGSAKEGLRPVHPYRWDIGGQGGGRLVEIPVTTMPLFRLPIHVSYLLQLHQVSPAVARGYFSTALRLCRLRRVQPSLLLHPLDLLDGTDAPRLQFFPGMALPAKDKLAVVGWALDRLARDFTLVGMATHAEALARGRLRERPSARAGIAR
jgi:peptidoglycan/xylan/chitin deacetylase (PgdA/CDA1 family)